MNAAATALAILVIGVPLAGCVGEDGADGAERLVFQASRTPAATRTGDAGLVVTVVDVGRVPVVAALVTVEASSGRASSATDEVGGAWFEALAPGPATVQAAAAGFRSNATHVELPPAGVVEVELVLQPQPTSVAFVETFEFAGFFECSATYLIVTGDCLALARAVADEVGVPLGNATNERFTFPFGVGYGWGRIVITQTWDEPAAGLGTMMRINLEPVDGNNTDGHGRRYARAEGTSPLTLTLAKAGAAQATASDDDAVVPEEGGTLRTRSFHLGFEETQDPAGSGLLGVGAAVQQDFAVVVEVHYH